jgi:acyl carrier protein
MNDRCAVMNESQRMDHATPEKPICALRRWVIETAGRTDDGALQPDTDLMQEDYIDSLGLISLILIVEKLRGAPIDEKDMSAKNFVSLCQIQRIFFAGDDNMPKTGPDCSAPAGSIEHA